MTFDEFKNSKTFQFFCKQIVADRRGALESLETQNHEMLKHKLWQIKPCDL
jgi:hypothetical protein